jgi:two-component system phosphate regulon response regulator PhoB
MYGLMVCERVKSRPETRNTRILAISGYIDDDEARMLTDYGFDDYMKKPFSLAELGDRVEKLLAMPSSKIARPKSQV